MSLTKTSVFLLFYLSALAFADQTNRVVVYNWTEYIPTGVIEEFEEQTGISVEYNTFESNESMYEKIHKKQGSGYDVIVPSTYYISKMATEGLLQKLDHKQLPNLVHLDPTLLDKPYDKGNAYSIPYIWGVTGIGVNTKAININDISSWQDLWQRRWKDSLLLTDDVRGVFHMALKINGHSANSQNPIEIKQAYELLKRLLPNVRMYNSDAPRMPFLAGHINLGMMWNGEAVMAQKEQKTIKFVYPKEGAALWMDSFAIPKGATNVKAAHAFINFLLKPEIAKQTVEYIGYATPNKTALDLLDENTRNNSIIFPPKHIVEQGEFHQDVGDSINLYNRYWQMLKAKSQ